MMAPSLIKVELSNHSLRFTERKLTAFCKEVSQGRCSRSRKESLKKSSKDIRCSGLRCNKPLSRLRHDDDIRLLQGICIPQ